MAFKAVARGGFWEGGEGFHTGDRVATNHDCVPETTAEGMSHNVFINDIGVHRKDDGNAAHNVNSPGCGGHITHIVTGSTTVKANGRGLARVDDLYDGGESVKYGSPNVFAGG